MSAEVPATPERTRRAGGEGWLLVAGGLALVATPAFMGWLAGLVALRLGVARRWLLGVAGLVVVVHVVRLGFSLERVYTEHLWLWAQVLPGLAASVGDAHPAPLRGLSLWTVARGMGHMAWLAVPLGLGLACVSFRRSKSGPEWSPAVQERTERRSADRLADARMAAVSPPGLVPPPLGVVLDGDLTAWEVKDKAGRWLQLPSDAEFKPRVLVGEPGAGKTTAFLRLVYTYARAGFQVVFVDGKGTDPTLPNMVLQAFLAGRGDQPAEVLIYPDEPATMWRGEPRDVVRKVMAVWTFAEQHQFFEAVAESGLSLALEAPGAPPITSTRELLNRLSLPALRKLHETHGTDETRATLREIEDLGKQWGLPGFALRLRSLLRSIGPTLDGTRGFEDVDLAVLTVPSGLKRKDASATMRVLLEEFGMYASGRKGSRPCLLVFDEFSALQGGRQAAMDLVERLRSTSTAVMLGVQSFEGLGAAWEGRRILNACSGGVLVFRTPAPEELVKLAGSAQVPDVSHGIDRHGVTERGMVRTTARFRVDPDEVRRLVPGECFYITGGRAAHLFIASNRIGQPARSRAFEARIAAQQRGREAAQAQRRHQEGTGNVTILRKRG